MQALRILHACAIGATIFLLAQMATDYCTEGAGLHPGIAVLASAFLIGWLWLFESLAPDRDAAPDTSEPSSEI